MLTECLLTTFPTRISMSIQFCRFFLGDTAVYILPFSDTSFVPSPRCCPFPPSSRILTVPRLAGAESRVDDECAGSHTWKAVQRCPELWWNQMDIRIIQDPLKRHFQHQAKRSIAKQHIFFGGARFVGAFIFFLLFWWLTFRSQVYHSAGCCSTWMNRPALMLPRCWCWHSWPGAFGWAVGEAM